MDNTEKTISIGALVQAICTFQNDDAVSRDYAISAILAGRAAYWSMVKYHDAVTAELQNALNKGIGFDEAIDAMPPFQRARAHAFVGRLIGLNDAARDAKREALRNLEAAAIEKKGEDE